MFRRICSLFSAVIVSAGCAQPTHEVVLASPDQQLRVGESVTVQARYLEDGKPVEGVVFAWRSLSEAIAEVDNEGRIYAIAEGTTQVIATAFEKDSPPLSVTVKPRLMGATLMVSPTTVSLAIGASAQLTASYKDSEGTVHTDKQLTWTASPPGVVTVASNGLLTGDSKGQAEVRAKFDMTESPAVLVTVVSSANEVANVTVSGPAQIEVGKTGTFTAIAKNVNGEVIAGKTFAFNSSATSVAQIDVAGVATGQAVGMTNITAVTEGVVSAPVMLEVKDPAMERSGAFTGSGNYTVTGTAMLKVAGNGLSLEFGSDFFSSSGPRLEVFLSTTPTVSGESVKLGALKASAGAQSYTVPSAVTSLSSHPYVIIECTQFSVRFGHALLQ